MIELYDDNGFFLKRVYFENEPDSYANETVQTNVYTYRFVETGVYEPWGENFCLSISSS